MGAVATGQHPDQGIRIVEILPDRDDLGAVILKNLDLFLAEALMQLVGATFEIADTVARRGGRVHVKLEAARVGRHVARNIRRQLFGRAAGRGSVIPLERFRF